MDAERLQRTLGTPAMARIVARVRRRLEQGDGIAGTLVLADPTPDERAAFDALVGRRASRGAALTIRLADLDARLREWAICAGLAEAIAHLTGPIEDLRAARAREEAAWASLFAGARAQIATVDGGPLWMDALRTTGLLRRLARGDLEEARALLRHAVEIVLCLPLDGAPIAELAASITGDSHALDAGEPLGTIVVRYAAQCAGLDEWEDAEHRREAWAAAGVLVDELCGAVLVLGLRPTDAAPTSRAMSLHADAGEPYRLSLRQLFRGRPVFHPDVTGPLVFACENPTILAAAANRLGPRALPLVCVEGNPRVAARLLLARLRRAGIAVAYHGDFDWPGLQIANRIIGRLGARPWRYDRAHYLAAVSTGARLTGDPVDAVWDPTLRDAMVREGTAVHEERVLDELCEDLSGEATLRA